MTITADSFFDWIIEIIQGINVFRTGTNYVALLILVLVACLLVSPRKPSNIKILAFPMMIGFTIIGLKVPLIFLGLGALIFVMETLSLQAIGNMIESVGQKISEIREIIPITRRDKEDRGLKKWKREVEKGKLEKQRRGFEEHGLIPFRKGTAISDVVDLSQRKSQEKKSWGSQAKRERLKQRWKLEEEKRKFWEVDE